ncbi:MAG: hypothetical protein ABH822_00300 [Patescibacteria group bacterium]
MKHKNLAVSGWQQLTLLEQLGNIGGEVSRALHWQKKDDVLFEGAVIRALELFDLTLEDERWQGRRWEIARVREVFCDIVFGKNQYHTSLQNLLHYFDQFAYAARLKTYKEASVNY